MLYQYGYDENDLRKFLEAYFKSHMMPQAQAALEYAWEKHKGATRISRQPFIKREGATHMNGQPFIIHPLSVAVYSIAIGADTEDQICIALLHDVCEDCHISPSELPFNERVRKAVGLLTFAYDFEPGDSEDVKQLKKIICKGETFARLIENPEALICKCIDRYNNLTTIEELPEPNIVKNVLETHRFLLPVVYNALNVRMYAPYHAQLLVLAINLRSQIDSIALHHNIELNAML